MWMRVIDAASFLGLSCNAVEERAIPWQDEPVPHRLRYKLLVLEADAKPRRRYFRQDVEALLRNPPRRRGPVAMFPRFV
jgi:hypothetical protein